MKFELDNRTGHMVPKKDDTIYFAGSMGGGLRIDDKKNNISYVIERDGRVTNIFGVRGSNLNIYDMRDARMIADRVLRKFGRSHKYTDYKMFLRGHHMNEGVIMSFEEYTDTEDE